MATNTSNTDNATWTSTLFNHSVASKAWLAVAGEDECTARKKVARAALEAQAKVFATPAPTLGGVRSKLSIWWGEELYDESYESSVNRKPLSNMSMEMCLRRMGSAQYTVHGFRSSFRDWAGEVTHFPREVAEMALAHAVGNATERSYRRGDSFEKRRELMSAWADFCSAGASSQPAATPLLPTLDLAADCHEHCRINRD